MTKTELNGKPAVKINCKRVVWGNTSKAILFKIGEHEKWVPLSVSRFDKSENYNGVGDIPGTLVVEEWFYNKFLKNL
jgi:hypothetical protein